MLNSIRDGLPVAGEAGSTLGPEWGRFGDANSRWAVGKVRAKTGTLTGAIALSGLTQGKYGRWKVFSFVEDDSSASGSAIKDSMDGLAATVNGCWAQRLLGLTRTCAPGADAPGHTFCEVPTVVLGAEERRGRL